MTTPTMESLFERVNKLRKKQMSYLTEQANAQGYSLDPGWSVEIDPDTDRQTYVSPDRWKFTDFIYGENDELQDYTALSPEGKIYTKAELEAQQTSEAIETNPEEAFPEFYEQLKRTGVAPTPQAWLGETRVKPRYNIDEVISRLYPEQTTQSLTDLVQRDSDAFIQDLITRGDNPDTRALLTELGAEEADINELFAVSTDNPFSQFLMTALPKTVNPETVEWATQYYANNPDKLRKELITVGRNKDTEALVKSIYPSITERGIQDYFNEDFMKFGVERAEEAPRVTPQRLPTVPGITKPSLGLEIGKGKKPTKAPLITTPAGNKVSYPLTDQEWNSMTPAEKVRYMETPQKWYEERGDWSKVRVAQDRIKIIAEIMGYPTSLDTTAEQMQLVITSGLEMLGAPGVLPKGAIGGTLLAGKKLLPKSAQAVLVSLKQFLNKVGNTKLWGKTKIAPEVAEKVKTIAKEPLPEVKPPAVETTIPKEGKIIPTPELTKGLQTEYTTLIENAEKLSPDNPTVIKAKEIISKITPENQRESLVKIESLEPELKGISKVTPGIKPAEGKAANIRLSKFNEDVQPIIKNWADTHPLEVQDARRGVIPDAQVRASAEQLMSEVGGDIDKLRAEWKPGVTWNAEELTAIRGTLAEKTKNVLNAQKLVAKSPSTENLLNLEMAVREQAAVQETVHGLTAEAGRALRSFRQSFALATDAQKMETLLNKVGKSNLERASELLGKLDVNDPIAVNKFIQSLSKPKIGDYLTEIYYNSILSGPKTHIVNSMSNTFNAIMSPIERAVSAVTELPLSVIQGRARQRFFNEVPADIFGAIRGIPEGFRQFAYVIKHGISLDDVTKWDLRTPAFRGKTGAVVSFPSRMLQGADSLMKAINMRAAINAEAHRLASVEKLTGKVFENRVAELLANPTAELLANANKIAEYRLFRQPLGKTGQALMRARESVDIAGIKPGAFLVPFIRTPMNLVKYGLERTPLGFGNPKLWANLIAKNPEGADQLARAIIGSVGLGSLVWYAQEGKITGAAPRSAAERERFYREGKQPYSIRVGEFWVSYQRLEPFNQLLSQVAIITEGINAKDKTIEEKISDATNTFGQNFVSQTYMSSISDLLNMLAEPERYAGNWLNRFVTAMAVPMSSASRTAAQMLDDTVRDPQNALQTIEANIPGLSKNVQAKITALGEDVKRKSPVWFPVSVTPVEETVLSQELERLKYDIGFSSTTISGTKLSDSEQAEYQKLAGQMIKKDLEKLMLAPEYWTSTDEEKNNMLQKVVTSARDWARVKMQEKLWGSNPAEERVKVLETASSSSDKLLGTIISETPTYTHEPPNIYDMEHELDSSYRTIYSNIPQESLKGLTLPPTVESWYDKEKARKTSSILPNQKLYKINTDKTKGTTLDDYVAQWQERSKITDERALAEFDNKYPNARLGNISRRDLDLLKTSQGLSGVELDKFIEDNPSLSKNAYIDWLVSHPTENAQMAIWGDAEIMTPEAYKEVTRLVKELDIPNNALPVFPATEAIFNKDYEYKKIIAEPGKGASSAEAMLLRVDNPDYDEWRTDPNIWGDSALKPIDQSRIPVWRIDVKYAKEDAEYEAIKNPLPAEQARLREEYLANNEAYRKDRRRREAYDLTNSQTGEKFPETEIENYVSYYEIPTIKESKRQERFVIDNPTFAQAMYSITGKDIWLTKPEEVPNVAYDDIYDQFPDLFDEMRDNSDSTSEYYIQDKDERTTRDKQIFDENPAFKEAYYRRKAYGELWDDMYVDKYATYSLLPDKGYSKERFLGANKDFYIYAKQKLGWRDDIDFAKIPSEEVEKLYDEYQTLPSGKRREDFRFQHQDLDAWMVITKKVSRSITETYRIRGLTPKEKFADVATELDTETDKMIEDLRKRLGKLK